MPEYVRVTDRETGHQYTVSRARYDVSPSLFRLLKQDATDPAGRPLPPTYKTSDASASGSTADTSASTTKEK